MTLEEARRKIGEELALARALADPSREDAQYHKGRRDALMLAKKALARVGDDILAGPRKELAMRLKAADRMGRELLTPEGRARESGAAWAYRNALALLSGEEEEEEEK